MNIQQKFNLSAKTAIITGASKGIGLAIAKALGEAGANLVISSRNQDALNIIADDFRKQKIEVVPVAAKVGQEQDHHMLIDKAVKAFGGIDILVNNAATNPVFGPLKNTDATTFDKIMNVNLKGAFELAKLCLPIMKERGAGSVINISSVGGISPEPQLGIYSVSKAALIALTKVMAKEWGRYSIRANAICPGLIKTKFSEALWTNETILEQVMQNQSLPMLAEPQSIAGLALLLASEAGNFCTGGVYTVDGGYTI